MTTPTVGQNVGAFVTGLLGGATGTLGGGVAGSNNLQQSLDQLTNSVNRLTNQISAGQGGASQQQISGATAGGFPGMINPFGPAGGGGGTLGGNVSPINTFGSIGAGLAGLGASFAGYGNQQLPYQLTMNTYAALSMLGMNNSNGGWNALYRQAFGFGNQNLNALATNPIDAAQMYQILQFTGGNPLVGSTSFGRAAYGATAAFGLTNPTLSGAASASLAQQLYSPQTSVLMRMFGYNTTPRTLGGGPASGIGNIMQSILQGWYNKNSVSPSQLYNTLSLGGRGYLNLTALGLDPNQVAPALEGFNKLFNAGYTPSQASQLFAQAGKATPAGRSAQATLSRVLGIQGARTDIQAIRNNQAALTGRDSAVAQSFNQQLQNSVGLLYHFNTALTSILQNTGLTGPVGGIGGFLAGLTGTNHGNILGGLGSAALMGRGIWSLFGGGAGGGLAGLGGAGGAAGATGGGLLAGATTATGIGAAALAIYGLLKWGDSAASSHSKMVRDIQKLNSSGPLGSAGPGNQPGSGIIDWIISNIIGGASGNSNGGHTLMRAGFAGGGIIPGYQPGLDRIPAMLSRGEAVLNPGAARAMGTQRINLLNALHKPAGSDTSLGNGMLHAAGGTSPVWPFPTRASSQYRRTDEGWDLQYGGTNPVNIYAVESGTLRTAGPDPNGFGMSYPLLYLDKPVGNFNAIYYGHTFPDTGKIGMHVNRGEEIGRTGGLHSGGNAYSDSNWLEIGFWPPSLANGPAMRRFLSGSSVGGYGGPSSGTPSGVSVGSSRLGGSSGSGASGIGFTESSVIPLMSEASVLAGGMTSVQGGSPGAMSSTPSTKQSSNGGFGSVSGLGGTAAQNKILMQKLAAKYGWGSGAMWSALNSVVMAESGYNQYAQNPTSTAYGIGQFLDSTWAGFGPKTSNPRLQEIYMLEYIKNRYGDPAGAWSHEQNYHWYGSGGRASGLGIVGDRGPELVNFGQGGGVMSNSRTSDLLRGNYAQPIQSPWMTGSASYMLNAAGSGHAPVNLLLQSGAVVFHIHTTGHVSPMLGREMASEFLKKLESEQLHQALAKGDKL